MLKNIFSTGPVVYSKIITIPEAIKGVSLGLLFGLVATIPWIIAANSGWVLSILGYLIGLATFKGFVLGAKKMHLLGKITIIAVILFAIPFAEMVIILIQGLNYGFPFGFVLINTPGIFFSGLSVSAGNIIIGYLFAFLGVYRFIIPRKVKQNNPGHNY